MKGQKLMILFFLFSALILVCSAFWSWSIYKEIQEKYAWPATEGVVLESRVVHSVESSQPKYPGSRRVYSYFYKLYVKYVYQLAEEAYISEAFSQSELRENSFGNLELGEFNPRPEMIEKLESYPPGARVQVKYNPQKPSEALLEVRKDWKLYIGPLFFAGFALLFCYVGLIVAFSSSPAGIPIYARSYFFIPVFISLIAILPVFIFILPRERMSGVIFIVICLLIALLAAKAEYRKYHSLGDQNNLPPLQRF